MIYFIQAEVIGNIKIGFTDADDADVRLAALQTGSPVPLKILATIPGSQEDEKNLHRRFWAHRVCGEWFKPVAELLDTVRSANMVSSFSCDGVEVVEQSVSIRVLTVGRKQFSKSLLEQLPKVECIDWRIVLDVEDQVEQIEEFAKVAPWGWCTGGIQKMPPYGHEYSFRWIIHVDNGTLCKQKDFNSASVHLTDSMSLHQKFVHLYQSRKRLPGWRDQDQLFFGV